MSEGDDEEESNTQDTLFFARAVGSIGAHIESGEYMDEVDEEWFEGSRGG